MQQEHQNFILKRVNALNALISGKYSPTLLLTCPEYNVLDKTGRELIAKIYSDYCADQIKADQELADMETQQEADKWANM
ncbi:MAG: hypothetical protein ACREQ5_26900 [Candidatus Dormibacteria bacterium]